MLDRHWKAAREAGQARSLGELYLVVQPRADLECARPDGRLEVLGRLDVQRHRAVPANGDHAGAATSPAAAWGSCIRWDVLVAEVFALEDTRRAREAYEKAKAAQRPFVRPQKAQMSLGCVAADR